MDSELTAGELPGSPGSAAPVAGGLRRRAGDDGALERRSARLPRRDGGGDPGAVGTTAQWADRAAARQVGGAGGGAAGDPGTDRGRRPARFEPGRRLRREWLNSASGCGE